MFGICQTKLLVLDMGVSNGFDRVEGVWDDVRFFGDDGVCPARVAVAAAECLVVGLLVEVAADHAVVAVAEKSQVTQAAEAEWGSFRCANIRCRWRREDFGNAGAGARLYGQRDKETVEEVECNALESPVDSLTVETCGPQRPLRERQDRVEQAVVSCGRVRREEAM